ncbi:hypothetical protein GGI20_001012 [Coemansia sp. BCRC 34301]|nr:hypothetical protein GGI20_001012 [Coemansia sp. BCRC 34301]
MQSTNLRAPLESMAAQYTVSEIDAQGTVTLQPQLSAQEEMAQQIAQLWDSYTNFQGLPDISDTTGNDDSDMESTVSDSDNAQSSADAVESGAEGGPATDMDAYAVRAKVHEQLTLAQSEIQVSLDMVRLLLAAKKRAARGESAGAGGSSLLTHDQAVAGSTAFAALVGGDIGAEVTVGGLPFPVGMVDTIKTERRAQPAGSEQHTSELKFVLGAKYRQLGEAADTLLHSSQRLQAMARAESGFWRTAFALRRRNWVVQQQRQLLGHSAARRAVVYGDRYFVRYGYADSGSAFAEDGLAEVLRPSDDAQRSGEEEESDVVMASTSSSSSSLDAQHAVAPLFIPSNDRRRMQVRLFGTEGQAALEPGHADSADYCDAGAATPLDRTHARLLAARRALFDRELYHRLCKEARVLDLGSVRSATNPTPESLIHDILVTSLSRDSTAVRLEWMLGDECDSAARMESENSFVAWQSAYYARLALVMAAMRQRRLHCEVKQHSLGANLPTRAHVSATSGRAPPPPDAFVAVAAAPPPPPPAPATATATGAATPLATGMSAVPSGSDTAGGSGSGSPAAAVAATVAGIDSAAAESSVPGPSTAFAVARADLLILAPVLQAIQFATWQHVLSAHTQLACAAWRRLIGEPVEVVSHFARSYRAPAAELLSARNAARTLCATGDDAEGMAYVTRMRCTGGSILAYRVDSLGNLVFIRGYFPPSPAQTTTIGSPLGEDDSGTCSAKAVLPETDQVSIHRLFRVIPLAGLPEFADQLRREMQSLVLLRVAAALSKCSYRRNGRRCQMGQWYVHQAQLCVVGECWEGARHRQIIGVPCWNAADSRPPVAAGLGDHHLPLDSASAWRLSLAFGPKHPTAFDTPPDNNGSRIPWTTVYPPLPGSPMAEQISELKTFEERLFKVLVSSF